MTAERHLDRVLTIAWIAAAATTAIVAVWVSAELPGEAGSHAFSNVSQLAAPLLASFVCWKAAKAACDRHARRGWHLVGLSTYLWFLGQLVWTNYETVQGVEVPFPSAADAGFLASVPIAIAGLLAFRRTPSTLWLHARTLLDGLIVAGSVLFVSWVQVLEAAVAAAHPETSALAQVLSLAYPVSDVAIITIVLVVASRSSSAREPGLFVVGAGFLALAVADSSFVATQLQQADTTTLADTMWFAGYALVALGALYGARRPSSSHTRDAGAPGRGALVLPFIPVLAVLVVSVAMRLRVEGWTFDGPAFWMAIAVGTLLLTRQTVVLLDNHQLTARLRIALAELEHRALHDPLTGLPNRTLLNDRVEVALRRAARSGHPLSISFIDLDHFKPINDEFGHETGDQVLIEIARRLRRVLRSSDTIARFGGDEFIVLCEQLHSTEDAQMLAQRMMIAIGEPIRIHNRICSVGSSVGVVVTNEPGNAVDELVRIADEAMYRAKTVGGGHIEVVDWTLPLVRDLGALLDSRS